MVHPDVAEYDMHPIAIMVLPIPLLILATVALGLRIWVRCSIVRIFGKDDVLLILAYVFFAAACGVFIALGVIEYTQGLTGPLATLGLLSISGIILYLLSQIFFKLSLAFFFLRILHQRWHRLIIISSVAVFVLFSVCLLVISVVQCGNPATLEIDSLSCMDWNTTLGPLNYAGATLNCTVDWIFAFTCIFVVSTLRLDYRSKFSVYLVILLATAGSIVSAVRIPYITGLRLDGSSYYSSKNDVIAYTSIIESAIGITAASMAVFKPIIPRLLRRVRIALSSGSPSSSPPSTHVDKGVAKRPDVQKQLPPKQSPRKPTAGHAIAPLFQAIPTPIDTEFTVLPGSGIILDLETGCGYVTESPGT